VQATKKTAKLLENLGHLVEEAEPDIDATELLKSFLMMYFGEVAAEVDELGKLLKRELKPSDVEPTTWTLNLLGRTYSAGAFVTAKRQWAKFSRSMARFHETYDLYLTPTTAQPPAKIGQLQPNLFQKAVLKPINTLGLGRLLKMSGLPAKFALTSFSRTPFTQLANLTGQPAMSVPLHWTSSGLPCGMQFIAPFGDEATLFRLAAQLEKEKPWFDQRPLKK
jgi:amidase